MSSRQGSFLKQKTRVFTREEAAVSRMLTASRRAMRPVAGGAVSLSRRAGAFAMGQRRAYQGNLQDKDRIFTNLCAPPTNARPPAGKPLTTCARVSQIQ